MSVLVEACVETVADAIVAEHAGAGRIEINRDLDRDGLTPPPGLIAATVDAVVVPVIAMVRPRPDHVCRDDDLTVMVINHNAADPPRQSLGRRVSSLGRLLGLLPVAAEAASAEPASA